MAGFLAGPQPLAVLEANLVVNLCESREGPIAWSGGGGAGGCRVCAVVHLQVHWDKEEVRIFEVGVASDPHCVRQVVAGEEG